MKTTKFFSVLSLALIFAAATVIAGNPVKTGGGVPLTPMVKHSVNIIVSGERTTCNYYQVEILDGKGMMVAPPKPYIPGITSYDFYERGPFTGTRIAVLVLSPALSHFACETELFTAPAALKGEFQPGQTYKYDLHPQTQAPRPE